MSITVIEALQNMRESAISSMNDSRQAAFENFTHRWATTENVFHLCQLLTWDRVERYICVNDIFSASTKLNYLTFVMKLVQFAEANDRIDLSTTSEPGLRF